MEKEVHYTLKRGTALTPEEKAMIEAAENNNPSTGRSEISNRNIRTPLSFRKHLPVHRWIARNGISFTTKSVPVTLSSLTLFPE